MTLQELARQVWSKNRWMFLLTVALAVLNVALYVAIEQLQEPDVAALEKLYIQRQAELRQLARHREEMITSPEYLLNQAERDLAEFQSLIPPYADFTSLIEELLVLADRAKLDITNISYRTGDIGEDELLPFGLSFSVKGPYLKIKEFIHALEQSERIMAIRDISFQGADQEDDTVVGVRLRLETLFRNGTDAG